MMKFSFPLASSDPFRSQKLARLWERSGSSVEAATQLEKKALEEEVEVKVSFNSKGQEAGKGGAHGADHVIFQELLTVAELVTMNVHDLYFGEPRDKRRGLFLLHKLLLKNKRQPQEQEFLEVERKMKSPAECAGGCGGAAGRGGSRSDGDMEVDDAGPPGAGDIRGEDVEDGGQEPQEHLEALQRICQDAVNRYCEHEKDAGAGADEPSEMLKAGEGEMNRSASKIALRPVPLPVDLATTTATEACSFGRPQIYVHPELRVGETERDGFGLYADGAIAPNSDVLKIPHPHVLNAINAFRDPDFRPFYEKLREQECDEEKIAMAYLIFLRKKFLQSRSSSGGGEQESVGNNGNFRSATATESHPLHFLVTKCLPADLDACPATLLQWPEEALENLYCPQLLYQVETQRMETNEFYSKLQQVFAEQDAPAADDSCTFDRGTSGIFTLDFDEVLYAKTIFDSRAFQLDVVVGDEVPLQESCDEDGDSISSGDVEMDVAGDQQAGARCDNNDVDKKMFGDDDEDEEDVRNKETNEGVENECGTMLSTSKRAQLIDGELFPEVRVTCLVPVADFLNHDRKSPLGVPRFERVAQAAPEDEPCFVLTTAASFGTSTTSTSSMSGGRTATQLTLNYGPLQNWELLFYYGFCFERNGADTLQLELGESDDAEQMLLLNLHEVTTDHVLAFPRPEQELLQGEEMQQVAPEASSGKKIRWPLAPKLLICLRVFHGVATADLNDCTWEKNAERGECDLQICDVLLEEVFGNLLIPEEDELLTTVMTATNRMWDAHPVYGLLAKRFRESQRKLVRANIQALENFKEQILGEMATKCKTVGGGGSAKKKRGGKRR
eukprot:g7665.t1